MAEQQSRPIRTLDQVLGLAPSTQAPPIKTLDEVLGLGVVQQEPDYESSGYLSDLLHAGGSGLERTTAALQAVSMLAGGPDMADNIAEYYQNSTQPEYMDAFNQRLAAASTRWDNAEGWWESMGALGSGAYQILRDPKALSYSIVENAANFLPSLGTGIAGAKVGTLIAPGAGSGVGFLTGMSAGTIATELGHKTLELASEFGADVTDGDSLRSVFADSDFRAEAAKQGLTKGAAIALVDALSFRLAGRVVTAPGRALNKKVEKELMDAGADIADPASVARAYARPDVAEKIAAHTEKYIAQSNRLTPKIGRGAAALGLESTGEGFGELSGEFLASGEVKPIDALHEAFAGMGQSAAQIGISKSLSAGKKQTKKLLQEARKAQVDKVAQGKDSQIDPGALNEALRQRLDDVDTVLEQQEGPAPIEVAEMEREIGRVDATTPLESVVSALPDLLNYETYKGRLQGAVRELEGDSLVMYVPLTKEEQAAMQAGGGLKRAVVASIAEEGVTPGANQSVVRVSVPTDNVLLKGNWSRGQLMISPDNVALAPLVSPQQAVQETEAAQDIGPALEQEQARLQRVQAQAALEEQAELGAAEGRAERAEKAPTVSAKRAATIRRESRDFLKRLPADKLITGKGRVKGDPRKLTTNELRKVVDKYNIPVERNLSQSELQDVVLSYKRALAKPTGPSINKVLRPKGYRLSRVFNKETDAHEIHLVPVKNNPKLANPVLAASSVDQISIPDYIDLIDERLAETGVTRSETTEVATQLQDVKAERKEEGRRVAQAAREQAAAEKKGKPTIKEAVKQAEEQFVTRDKAGVHINEEGLQNFAESLQEGEFWTKRLTKEFDAYVERLRREQALSQAPVMPIGPLKGRRTVFFEAVPDPSLPEYEPIRQLGYIQRENFTNRAAKLLQTRNGTDALLGKIANIYVKQKPGVGGYEKTVNPNILMTLSPKSDTDQIADVYSWAVQYIFRQAAVPWAIPDNSLDVDSDAVTAGAHFKFKGKIGGASEALFYKELRESLGVDSGYTKISPTDIIVLNFDLDKSKFARRIGRFNGKASKKFGFQTEWFTSRGEYHEANWNEDPHGESIRDKIREAGFSDLLPFLDSRFAAFNKLAAEYGVKVPKEKATQEDGRPSRSRSDRGAREPPLVYHGGDVNLDLRKDEPFHVGTRKAAQDRMDLESERERAEGGPTAVREDKRAAHEVVITPKNEYLPEGKMLDERNPTDLTELNVIQNLKSRQQKLREEGYDSIPYINAIEDEGSISYLILDTSIVKVTETEPKAAETSPTKAPDQGAFSLAPEVKSDEVVLVHYSQQKNLTKTDPAYHGTGYQGAEKKRKESFPDTYVDRTYFGFLDYRREGGLGPNQYQAKIPFARLYDFARDPDGLNTATTFDRVNRYEQAIKNAGYAGYYVKTGRGTVAAVFEEIELEAPGAFALLHHGTPHKWESGVPDLSKVGTGEGAQTYGHGIYFAERSDVARGYRDRLSGNPSSMYGSLDIKWDGQEVPEAYREAASYLNDPLVMGEAKTNDAAGLADVLAGMPGYEDSAKWLKKNSDKITATPTGNLYKVDIPDAEIDRMLDWDKPLSEQSDSIQSIIQNEIDPMLYGSRRAKKLASDPQSGTNMTGGKLYQRLEEYLAGKRTRTAPTQKVVSDYLASKGIPGIKYLDQGSRDAGKGTRNFVIFDEKLLSKMSAFALLHHGTPGTWASGAPDLNFLGTGEGAQAFGWGLYFAQRKGVAEDYWTTLSPKQYFVDGKPYDVTNQKDRISASYARSEERGILQLKQEFLDDSFNQGDELQAEIDPIRRFLLDPDNLEEFNRLVAEREKVADKRDRTLEQFDEAKNTEEALKALGRDADDLHNAILDVVAPNLSTLGYLAELEFSSRDAAKQTVETDRDYLNRARKDRSLIGKITTERGGNVYTVELDDSVIDNLLDWDAPFSKQPPKVKAALVELTRKAVGLSEAKEYFAIEDKDWGALTPLRKQGYVDEISENLSLSVKNNDTGATLYRALEQILQSKKNASLALNSLDVPGLKYYDGVSRRAKKGTHNIVLWDQDTLNTLEVPIPDKTFWALQKKPALSGLSTSKAREVLQKQFGPVVDKLESEGILEIVRSVEQVPQELITGDAALRARAVYDKRTSKAYLITSRLNEGNVGKILLHEVGVHYGLRRMLGDRSYAELILDINNQKDGALKPYFDYVRESYGSRLQNESSDAFVEEVIARIAEDTSEQTLSIREKIWVAVRAFLNRLFGTNFKITDREIGYIIRGGSGFVSDLLRQKGSLRTAADQGYTPPYMLLNDSPAFGQRTIGFPEYTQPIRDFTARHIQYRVANPDGTKLPSKEEAQLRKNMNRMLKHADTLGKSIKGVDVHLPIAADTTNLTSRYALFKNNRTGTELVIRVSNHSKDMATAIGSFPFVSYNNAHKQDIDFADTDKAVRMLAEGKAEGKNALEFYILHRLGDVLAPLTDKQLDRLGDYANFKRAILKVKPDLFKRLVAIETRQDLNSAAVINDDNAMFALGPPVERNEVQEGLVRELTHTKSRTLFEHLEESRLSRWDWLVQGMIDTYRPIAKLEKFGANTAQRAWQMMHLSENTHGLLSAVLNYGTPKEVTRDGQFDWYDIDRDQQGLLEVLRDLGGGNEVDNFLAWVAMNRADTLMKEGREKHFTEQQIREGMRLNRGRMEDGRNRATVYMRAMRGLSIIQKSMLDMAERAGVIDPELRKTLQTDFYVPFYREFDHKDKENIRGPSPTYDFVNMKNTIKKLQGSELGVHDILHNMVMNWTALMSASMKNRAGREAMEAAVDAGVATKIEDDQDAAQMAFAKRHAKKSKYENYVYVMEGGKKVWYNVHDPLVLNALASLTSGTLNTSWIRPFQTTKRVFTLGTTLSPAFRIRNLIRDSVNSIAVGKLNYNIFGNVATGYRAMAKGSVVESSMLAGGGGFSFGFLNDDPSAIRRLVNAGVKESRILDTTAKAAGFLKEGYQWYQNVGNKIENANRAALYMQRRGEVGHLQASFESRDLLNFSSHGRFAFAQILTAWTPFLNARLMGLDKLGRAMTGEERGRMVTVTGALVLASIGYMLSMEGDPDYEELEDWVKDTYWPIKLPGGDTFFFLPKPFEIGAVTSIAETITKNFIDSTGVHAPYTAARIRKILMAQLAFDPRPQLLRPMIEVGTNKDAFLDRRIESLSWDMQKVPKTQRKRAYSSEIAISASELMGVLLPDWMEDTDVHLSPVQIDHLIRGYLGWAGANVVASADYLLREQIKPAITGREPAPRASKRIDEMDWVGPVPFPLKSFVSSSPRRNTIYLTRLYEQMEEVKRYYAKYLHYREHGMTDEMMEVVAQRGDLLKWRKTYNSVQTQLGKISKRVRQIERSHEMTPDEKRKEIDRLTEMRGALAKRVVEARAKYDSADNPSLYKTL